MLKPSNLGKEPCDAFAASVPTSSVAAYMIFFCRKYSLDCRQGSPDAIFSEISFSSGPVEVPAKGKIATSIDRYIFKNRWATALCRKQSHIFTSRLFQIWRVSRTAIRRIHPPHATVLTNFRSKLMIQNSAITLQIEDLQKSISKHVDVSFRHDRSMVHVGVQRSIRP